jgi:hypothetical protein
MYQNHLWRDLWRCTSLTRLLEVKLKIKVCTSRLLSFQTCSERTSNYSTITSSDSDFDSIDCSITTLSSTGGLQPRYICLIIHDEEDNEPHPFLTSAFIASRGKQPISGDKLHNEFKAMLALQLREEEWRAMAASIGMSSLEEATDALDFLHNLESGKGSFFLILHSKFLLLFFPAHSEDLVTPGQYEILFQISSCLGKEVREKIDQVRRKCEAINENSNYKSNDLTPIVTPAEWIIFRKVSSSILSPTFPCGILIISSVQSDSSMIWLHFK